MGTLNKIQASMLAVSWAFVALLFAPGARADTPMCNAIVNDPTIPTCSCICESGSTYSGCNGLSAGTQAPTPGQCPDMLQGRHVLSRGDALVIASPRLSGSANTVALGLLYGAENDPDNNGLGVINGSPSLTLDQDIGCRTSDTNPFPDHVVLARLFDLPYDMMVAIIWSCSLPARKAGRRACPPTSGKPTMHGLNLPSATSITTAMTTSYF